MSQEPPRLFPVFYKNNVTPTKPRSAESQMSKKIRAISQDQMLLDAGQKRWGVTQCHECRFIYHLGDPGDEIMHNDFHKGAHLFKHQSWKNERVVCRKSSNRRIIQIFSTDSNIWWKKVKLIVHFINQNIGSFDLGESHQVFLYINRQVIVGVLVAQPQDTAYRLLTKAADEADMCSEESYKIKCEVSRIWVSPGYRRQKIATTLMDTLKQSFIFGTVLNNDDIAFSSPTVLGKEFGAKYFERTDFLVTI